MATFNMIYANDPALAASYARMTGGMAQGGGATDANGGAGGFTKAGDTATVNNYSSMLTQLASARSAATAGTTASDAVKTTMPTPDPRETPAQPNSPTGTATQGPGPMALTPPPTSPPGAASQFTTWQVVSELVTLAATVPMSEPISSVTVGNLLDGAAFMCTQVDIFSGLATGHINTTEFGQLSALNMSSLGMGVVANTASLFVGPGTAVQWGMSATQLMIAIHISATLGAGPILTKAGLE